MLKLLTAALLMSSFSACVTERAQPTCKEVPPANCVGTNVKEVCDTVDGCRRCQCFSASGQLLKKAANPGAFQ